LRDSKLDIRILSYLWTYGSTRESDLMDWGVHRLDQSAESMKAVLDEMDNVGRIMKIVHSELEPQEIYIAIGLTLEFGLQLAEMADSLGLPRPCQHDIECVRQILEETASTG
jgi:hypothetical protein